MKVTTENMVRFKIRNFILTYLALKIFELHPAEKKKTKFNTALRPVIAKVRVRFQVKPEFIQVVFQPLTLFVLLRRSCSLS